METLLLYVAKVNIALALFYVVYAILLKKDTFIKMRRYFFLSAIVFSFIYPLFTIAALGDIDWVGRFYSPENQATVVVEKPTMAILPYDAGVDSAQKSLGNKYSGGLWRV